MLYTLEKRFDEVKFEKGIVALLDDEGFFTPVGKYKIRFTGDEGYEECVRAGVAHPIPGGVIIYDGISSVNWPYSYEFRFNPKKKVPVPMILIRNIYVRNLFDNQDFDGIQDGENALIFLHDISKERKVELDRGYIKWRFDEIEEIVYENKIIYKKERR
jgi:hypothetical protein